ncbi:hypothetical protein CLV58_12553 [Spirosoma oryzae]|uniref:Uncharacterized protein n=1 Tax=Spirosoma oryzae TaxID=1469603 RepID=A0A2T0S8T0_9BACT|nr:hypothetical protein [Spirosoma oryzae]PRY29791.1 hypothetical protein CLV58_12553 [Spirosoma oryzae]
MSKLLFLWLYLPPLILIGLRVLSYFALPDRKMKYRTIQEDMLDHSGLLRRIPAWLLILLLTVVPFVNLIVALIMLLILVIDLVDKWRTARAAQQEWNKQNRVADSTTL